MKAKTVGEHSEEIDFSLTGIHVRSIFDPAKAGYTTGRVVPHAGRNYAFIRLVSGEIAQYPCEQLELVPKLESRADAIKNFRFSGPDSLQRSILMEKVRGRLTEIFYSMESGHADFYPHQFKPILKLISSTGGRILIADEVGLGKTIEAIYVWKELQARFGARRLLVVCPSMLQPKWQAELRDRFSIDSTIVDAKQLHQSLLKATNDPSTSFTLIGSLESLRARRPRNDDYEPAQGPRQQLAAFLAANEEARELELLDLVIIDEAHYLRNPATAANYLGTLLAGASTHLVLLTATPIQIGSQNLFQLLSLLDADRYASMEVFNFIREANKPITAALNALLHLPVDIQSFQLAITQARQSQLFADDAIIAELSRERLDLNRPAERVRIARALEQRSLLGDVLTRTRKRDVIENRVVRNPTVLRVPLTQVERQLYDQVKKTLRARALNSDSGHILTMIARLRQLASSIPAAVAGWRINESLSELLWEDLGLLPEDVASDDAQILHEVNQQELEAVDSKYGQLYRFLRDRLSKNVGEKIVLFSFYRGTVRYLERRLRADGISCTVIMGGMGDEKHSELARFEDPAGPAVLLSSEIGSEGIDLQFAQTIINYDLPWNPMKVEQRIGRIDRLGQKANRIHIISFVVQDTIEEIILDRLYQRLEIFRQSIGDLEEVLGESTDELLLEYFRDGLSDEELSDRLDQNALMAEGRRLDVRRLEEEAPELVGHRDFILSNIQKSRETGRWLSADDILTFILDVLTEFYPGSRIERHKVKEGFFDVNLSPEARASLSAYIDSERPPRWTRLHVPGETVPVVFDISHQVGNRPKPELLDITHPLVLWLRSEIEHRGPKQAPSVAIQISAERTGVAPGLYVFATDFWRFEGLHKQIVLRHCVLLLNERRLLDEDQAERFIGEAARFGKKMDMFAYERLRETVWSAFKQCEDELTNQFSGDAHLFQLENEQRVHQAEVIAKERAAKKLQMLQERLSSQRASTDERRRRAIQLTEGQIRRLEADRDQRLARIQSMLHAQTASRSVSGGIILVR